MVFANCSAPYFLLGATTTAHVPRAVRALDGARGRCVRDRPVLSVLRACLRADAAFLDRWGLPVLYGPNQAGLPLLSFGLLAS